MDRPNDIKKDFYKKLGRIKKFRVMYQYPTMYPNDSIIGNLEKEINDKCNNALEKLEKEINDMLYTFYEKRN